MNSHIILDRNGIKIDGEYKMLLCSSLFYFRIPRSEWQDRIEKLLKIGCNTADVYFPWNYHEKAENEFDFSENRDVEEFLRLCEKNGLYVIARFGPYICSEWTSGGLPAQVVYHSGKIRTTDEYYLSRVRQWYAQILPRITAHQIDRGGCVILAQLENELDFFDCDDVNGYISFLRDEALSYGMTVPLFCCAGEGNVLDSGGCVEGILPTYNFYPSEKSQSFDSECRAYAEALAEDDHPLLVTETGRRVALHKREFAAGAKLIGAYNQVAGTNTEYYHSLTNWGDVASLIVTEYGFSVDRVVDSYGRFGVDVGNLRLFSAFISELGERAALSIASPRKFSIAAEFRTPFVQNAVKLNGGGELLCLANLSDAKGYADVEGMRVCVDGMQTVLLPFDLPFAGGVILRSNYEVYSLNPLTFYGNGECSIRLKIGEEIYNISESGEYGGVSVHVFSTAEMIERDFSSVGIEFSAEVEKIGGFAVEKGKIQMPSTFKRVGKDATFEANGIWEGNALYRFTSQTKKVLLKNSADFLSVYDGGKYVSTTFERGKSKILDFESTQIELRVEKWGGCNFDDSRESSLRIASTRGIAGAYEITRSVNLQWHLSERFTLDRDRLIVQKDKYNALVHPNNYLTTKVPFEGVYYTEFNFEEGEHPFFSLENGEAECKVFVGDRFVGEIGLDRNILDLSEFVSPGRNELHLYVRKRVFTERAGDANLIMTRSLDVKICPFGKEFMREFSVNSARKAKFPIRIKAGTMAGVTIDLAGFPQENLIGVFSGRHYKATVVSDGTVIARLISDDFKGIIQVGGDAHNFYLPYSWRKNGQLKLFLEAVQGDAVVDLHFERVK